MATITPTHAAWGAKATQGTARTTVLAATKFAASVAALLPGATDATAS